VTAAREAECTADAPGTPAATSPEGEVKFKMAMGSNLQMNSWLEAAQAGKMAEARKSCSLVMFDAENKPVARLMREMQAQKFHLSIVAGSHNSTLIEMHSHLNIRLYRIRYLAVMKMQEWIAAAGEHGELMRALKEHDSERLTHLQKEHLRFAWRLIGAWSPPAAANGARIFRQPRRA